LRGFIVPRPGHKFIGADFSSIEARVLAWLAGEEEVLEVFRTHGKIYEKAAAEIYGVKLEQVTKAQRQIGKVAILALGYGGGKGAFQQMAKGYGVKVSDDEAEGIKTRWREANSKIVNFWYALENAAFAAISIPGKIIPCRGISFKLNGSFLWAKLPSGRCLCYPYPKLEIKMKKWGSEKETLTYMTEDSLTRKWVRCETYGGSLCENVTQAVARDVLAEAIIRLEEANYPVVMHVHDEILCEVPEIEEGDVEKFEEIMSSVPPWASGLPIKAEGWSGERYQK
jgi:DNA polymerase